MTTYILIIVLATGWTYGGVAINHVEFNSLEACQKALNLYKGQGFDIKGALGSRSIVNGFCTEK